MNETVRPRTRGELLDAWRRHLTLQRGLSEHTARAYVGDVGDLLSFLGVGDDGTEPVGPALASLDLADLRDWLARMSTSGRARATIARRAAAAKAFSTWAHRLALLPADAAARLRSPRADNRLPAGLTEDQAKAQGIKVKKGVFPWTASGRAIANGRDEGVTKLLFDDSPEAHGHGRILGGGIVGTHAGDMIGEIALAIEMGADAVDIGKTIHPHPTLGESLGMAAEVAHGSCTDLPPQRK